MLYESIEHADDMFLALELKFILKTESNTRGFERILYYKTNREALTVLCSVIKHAGSG